MDKIKFLNDQLDEIEGKWVKGRYRDWDLCEYDCHGCPIDKYDDCSIRAIYREYGRKETAMDVWMFLNLLLEIEYQGE